MTKMNTGQMDCRIASSLKESASIKEAIAKSKINEIKDVIKATVAAFKRGGKVVLFGNGGSAADAQHIACDLMSRLRIERQALPAIALATKYAER